MSNSKLSITTPTVRRRLICMIYETLLLAAVELAAVAVYLLATQNRQTTAYTHGLQFTLFLVTAAYFIHFWSDSGHTLAMKTWRIKLVKPGYARLPIKIAAARFMLAWGWFLPALVACYAFDLHKGQMGIAIGVGMAAWAATAFLDKDRQMLHDKLLGTRLILLPKPVKANKNKAA
ncbi:RDD family protein [Janthinobacterium fluminis]|uniref:RDD family protein n=1 Tax=Janthinobacterium fluminis TaxID=2987524 RepID=A0ABT5JUF6_9BURK|nr:RDD family protein [Janthinobacterium fluminis]MDC8756045.1 RDD family protein [Janthinobacterium fluminis]